LEAAHGIAVHQNLEPNLGKVGVPETNAVHASREVGRRSCSDPRLGQQPAELFSVFEIVVELILVGIECPNERKRDRGSGVIVWSRAMNARCGRWNVHLDFAAAVSVVDSAFENIDTRLTDDERTG
jgi:hypothetical protein